MNKERFTEVLTEFQIAESIVRLGHHRSKDSLILNDSVYAAIFRKLSITQADFDSNFQYYSNRPKEFEKIYEQVIDNLSIRSAEITARTKKKPENKVVD